MTAPRKPSPAKVAEWVDTIAAGIPRNYGGAAAAEVRARINNAKDRLSSHGLDVNGQPKVAATTPRPDTAVLGLTWPLAD